MDKTQEETNVVLFAVKKCLKIILFSLLKTLGVGSYGHG
jgi:hypothetical protein